MAASAEPAVVLVEQLVFEQSLRVGCRSVPYGPEGFCGAARKTR